MGVRTIRTLSQVPVPLLQREFGKNGLSLWKKANGIDRSPVVPYRDQKSMSSERTFAVDSIDLIKIKSILTKLTSQLVFDLREASKLTSCVTVKIRYTDFNTYTRQKRIAYTANEKTLLQQVLSLFDRLYERRQLIRLVGIRFSGLVSGHHQLNLLEDSLEDIHLQQAMDRIRRRFGKKSVGWASALKPKEKGL